MPVLLQEGRLLHARRACSQIQKGMFSNAERHLLKCRRAYSQIQKGMFSNTERHILKYRKALSSVLIRTHCIHVGAKQIYIKIKYSSPSHALGTSSELCHWLHFVGSMRNADGQTGAVFLLVKSGWARCPV